MANVDELIPFILHFEAGVTQRAGESVEQLFDRSRKSGFANDPLDSGGATMCGVTLATYKTYRSKQWYHSTTAADLKNISYKAWRAIFKQMYWDRWLGDRIAQQPLANIVVDWVWASGVHGIKEPQKILAGVFPEVVVDGIVGNKTLNALNSYAPQQELFDLIHNARTKFVEDIVRRKPSQQKWLNGWLRRINAITWYGLTY